MWALAFGHQCHQRVERHLSVPCRRFRTLVTEQCLNIREVRAFASEPRGKRRIHRFVSAAAPESDGSCLPETSSRTHAQARGLELLLVLLIHAVVAVVLLGVVLASAQRMKPRSGQNLQSFFAGALGAVGTAVREGA